MPGLHPDLTMPWLACICTTHKGTNYRGGAPKSLVLGGGNRHPDVRPAHAPHIPLMHYNQILGGTSALSIWCCLPAWGAWPGHHGGPNGQKEARHRKHLGPKENNCNDAA